MKIVLDYPRDTIEHDMYMNIHKRIETRKGICMIHVLKIIMNLYGHKQAGRVCDKCFMDNLLTIGFKKSSIDEFVLFQGRTILSCCVDDSIFYRPRKKEINQIIKYIGKVVLYIKYKSNI